MSKLKLIGRVDRVVNSDQKSWSSNPGSGREEKAIREKSEREKSEREKSEREKSEREKSSRVGGEIKTEWQ